MSLPSRRRFPRLIGPTNTELTSKATELTSKATVFSNIRDDLQNVLGVYVADSNVKELVDTLNAVPPDQRTFGFIHNNVQPFLSKLKMNPHLVYPIVMIVERAVRMNNWELSPHYDTRANQITTLTIPKTLEAEFASLWTTHQEFLKAHRITQSLLALFYHEYRPQTTNGFMDQLTHYYRSLGNKCTLCPLNTPCWFCKRIPQLGFGMAVEWSRRYDNASILRQKDDQMGRWLSELRVALDAIHGQAVESLQNPQLTTEEAETFDSNVRHLTFVLQGMQQQLTGAPHSPLTEIQDYLDIFGAEAAFTQTNHKFFKQASKRMEDIRKWFEGRALQDKQSAESAASGATPDRIQKIVSKEKGKGNHNIWSLFKLRRGSSSAVDLMLDSSDALLKQAGTDLGFASLQEFVKHISVQGDAWNYCHKDLVDPKKTAFHCCKNCAPKLKTTQKLPYHQLEQGKAALYEAYKAKHRRNWIPNVFSTTLHPDRNYAFRSLSDSKRWVFVLSRRGRASNHKQSLHELIGPKRRREDEATAGGRQAVLDKGLQAADPTHQQNLLNAFVRESDDVEHREKLWFVPIEREWILYAVTKVRIDAPSTVTGIPARTNEANASSKTMDVESSKTMDVATGWLFVGDDPPSDDDIEILLEAKVRQSRETEWTKLAADAFKASLPLMVTRWNPEHQDEPFTVEQQAGGGFILRSESNQTLSLSDQSIQHLSLQHGKAEGTTFDVVLNWEADKRSKESMVWNWKSTLLIVWPTEAKLVLMLSGNKQDRTSTHCLLVDKCFEVDGAGESPLDSFTRRMEPIAQSWSDRAVEGTPKPFLDSQAL